MASSRLTSIRLLDSGGRPQKKRDGGWRCEDGLSATKNFLDTHRSTSGMGGIAAEPIKARFDKFDRGMQADWTLGIADGLRVSGQ